VKILQSTQSDFSDAFAEVIKVDTAAMDVIVERTRALIDEVKEEGDSALLKHIGMFDRWSPESGSELVLHQDEMKKAYESLDEELKNALHLAHDRIYAYHEKQLPKSWIDFEANGTMLGQKVTPVDKAGLYIPGGKASYPSSMLMNAIPAKVAGVACVPTPDNELNPLVLAAAYICGVDEVFKVGGASAIAAMAFGTESIDKTDVITGPGNIYVATAKQLLFGEVNIDMIAGPSEIGILADKSADPELIAIDLLSQAEHDEMARSILITDDVVLAESVSNEVENALKRLPRETIARTSIENNGVIIVAKDMDEALMLMNRVAPEHLEVVTENAYELLPYIKHAGAIFLGRYTPEAIGDYIAGPNHTLPTSGTARFFSPLNVENYMKKSSIIGMSAEGLKAIGPAAALLAETEGLDAHRLSVTKRLDRLS